MWGWDGGEGFVSARLLTLLPAAVPFPNKERKETNYECWVVTPRGLEPRFKG